jgi:hypothetical protein
MTLPFLAELGPWTVVSTYDARARALADRHYPRQSVGALQFMPPGERLVLLTHDGRAVWGVVLNRYAGVWRWRVSIFRNEGDELSSSLVHHATAHTFAWWRSHYGALPSVALTTEIDPARVRRKRDPGRCFRRAGWDYVRTVTRAKRVDTHIVFAAPGEAERLKRGVVALVPQMHETTGPELASQKGPLSR